MKTLFLIILMIIAGVGNVVTAQESGEKAVSDETATATETSETATPDGDDNPTDAAFAKLQAGANAFADLFDKSDAAAIASLWTKDGEYVDVDGNTHVGQTAIEDAYAEYFRNNEAATIRINIDSFKRLSDSAVIEEGSTLVEVPPASATIGRYMAIHVKADGEWKMASVRDTLVDAEVSQQNLADLDFLIGTWIAEEHGIKSESVCQWVCENKFVRRDFTTIHFDGSKLGSGTQLIGWNPQAGHIQSWTFSPDGGHDIGIWTATEDGWAAQMQGMTGDGRSTTATNFLRRLDDNAYVWQSVNRTIDGIKIPDTDEIVIRRQTPSK